jgi:hypothetical protein
MANQVSIKAVANKFISECDSLSDYLQQQNNNFTGKFLSYAYDFAIVKIFKDFEELLLNTIIGIINNQAPYIKVGHGGFRKKSIVKSQAEAIFLRGRYFSFKGANGLLTDIRTIVPSNHWITTILSDTAFNRTFSVLIPLRNFAAHSSKNAKQRAITAVGLSQLGQSGAWLKASGRFDSIINDLRDIATRIRNNAPY